MTIQMVLLPVFVQVALTFGLLFWMACVRTGEHQPRRDQDARHRARPVGLAGASRRRSANCYDSQFQIPLLFYVLVILAWITQHADLIFVVMAWIFVLLRHRATPTSTPPRTMCRRASGCSRPACSCC